jgi:hypothetical protein
MKLDFVMLADRASTGESGKLDIEGAGVTHVIAPELPYHLPSLAIIFGSSWTNGREHHA